uniref:Uncharacterized protein n=1 Tax=Mus musculus TaxID=10090 RepID=Q3UR77_MOUSE|nr:unnamed protein product [Mus musculus]
MTQQHALGVVAWWGLRSPGLLAFGACLLRVLILLLLPRLLLPRLLLPRLLLTPQLFNFGSESTSDLLCCFGRLISQRMKRRSAPSVCP